LTAQGKGLGKLELYTDFGGGYQKSAVYTYSTEGKVFVSGESEDDAWYKGTLYKYEQGLTTNEEIEKEYAVFSRRDVMETVSTTDFAVSQGSGMIAYAAAASRTTYVKGYLYWTTSTGVKMSLKLARVDLYDDELIGAAYLQTTYTDINGYYSFSFQNPDAWYELEGGGYDVFIRWYPDSYTFQVARDWVLQI
jgi:hypothetical protein